MSKYPKYFQLDEFLHSDVALKNRIRNYPTWEAVENLNKLALLLDKIREKLGMSITITSGFRSLALNKKIGGSATSQHRKGEAADCECEDNKKLFDTVKQMIDDGEIEVAQLIWEYGTKKQPEWVHISIPDGKHKNEILYIGVK